MNKSESIKNIASAIVAAQAEIENAEKNSTNPHFKNKYADLSAILESVKPVFAKNKLAVLQFERFVEPNKVELETVLLHESGEWISEVSGCFVSKPDAQGIGSAVTYLRRYSLAAAAGITQVDDDGNTASVLSVKDKIASLYNSYPKEAPFSERIREIKRNSKPEWKADLLVFIDSKKPDDAKKQETWQAVRKEIEDWK
jgi:hypothetical protein